MRHLCSSRIGIVFRREGPGEFSGVTCPAPDVVVRVLVGGFELRGLDLESWVDVALGA